MAEDSMFNNSMLRYNNSMLRDINEMIASMDSEYRQEVSDGYHTFKELYDHRIALYILTCKVIHSMSVVRGIKDVVWRSKKHSDRSTMEGWFVLGIYSEPGHQVTYHIPNSQWGLTDFAETLEVAPPWDRHNSEDVLHRLYEMIGPLKKYEHF